MHPQWVRIIFRSTTVYLRNWPEPLGIYGGNLQVLAVRGVGGEVTQLFWPLKSQLSCSHVSGNLTLLAPREPLLPVPREPAPRGQHVRGMNSLSDLKATPQYLSNENFGSIMAPTPESPSRLLDSGGMSMQLEMNSQFFNFGVGLVSVFRLEGMRSRY